MNNLFYSSEQNIQIVVALLKSHGIKKIIVSPGGTNVSFVASVQHDDFFEIYSCIDERSAAYMACGLSAESNEIVALSCTGATSSRNYMPALTEAYYRKLPILAITSHCGEDWLYHLRPQQIDRKNGPADVFVGRYMANFVKDLRDFRACEIEVNRALLALKKGNNGPVLLNLYTIFDPRFDCKELPSVRTIKKITVHDQFPSIKEYNKIVVFIGSHKHFTRDEMIALEEFCLSNNAVAICDHTSGYNGKYAVNMSLAFIQQQYVSPQKDVDLLVHIGEISGDYYSSKINAKTVWRINTDGEIRDTFGSLEYVFEMEECAFFNHYSSNVPTKTCSAIDVYSKEYEWLLSSIPELPFSNLWIAQQTHDRIPDNSRLHFAILNSLRSWNFFKLREGVRSFCNVGGFGIDGALSTVVGASFANRDLLFFAVIGDLAFFYDMNALGNKHLCSNLRILLVNNGKGTEFRNRESFAYRFGDSADSYMAAAGHNGNKSPQLVRHYAEDLGFTYITASDKTDFLKNLPLFVDQKIGEKPILFEVFTNSEDECAALDTITQLANANEKKEDSSFKGKIASLGKTAQNTIKTQYNNIIDKLKL